MKKLLTILLFLMSGQSAQAAAATGLYCESTNATAATTTWVDVCQIDASSFVAGKKYLILASAFLGNSNSASLVGARLVRGLTPTAFTDSTSAIETAGDQKTAYGYFTVFEQPGGGAELIKLQINNSAVDTTTMTLGQVFALKLSDDFVEGTDWHYTEVTTDYTTTTAFSGTDSTEAASVTFTPNGTDNWLVLVNAAVGSLSLTSPYRMSLFGSVETTDEPSITLEGEDAADIRNHLLTMAFTPTAASHIYHPRFNHSSTAVVVNSSRTFALNLNKFRQNAFTYLITEEQPAASPTWTTTRTLSPTPEVTGNWFILGSLTNDIAAFGNDLAVRLQVNAAGGGLVSNPAYGDDAPDVDGWDNTDDIPVHIFKLVSLSTGAARDINLDVTAPETGTTQRVEDRHLVAFSLELPAGAPPPPQIIISQNVPEAP